MIHLFAFDCSLMTRDCVDLVTKMSYMANSSAAMHGHAIDRILHATSYEMIRQVPCKLIDLSVPSSILEPIPAPVCIHTGLSSPLRRDDMEDVLERAWRAAEHAQRLLTSLNHGKS